MNWRKVLADALKVLAGAAAMYLCKRYGVCV
jgi:hypothetical protein